MKITTIRASAGRTIPHPSEFYANLKFVDIERDRRLAELNVVAAKEAEARNAEYERARAIRDAEHAVRDATARLERIRAGKNTDSDEIPF